jgi:hypothetical protein
LAPFQRDAALPAAGDEALGPVASTCAFFISNDLVPQRAARWLDTTPPPPPQHQVNAVVLFSSSA